MVQHRRVPPQLQEAEQFPHLLLRAQHKALVVDGQASVRAGGLTLLQHGLHGAAPLGQAVSVAGQVEARDGDLGNPIRRRRTSVRHVDIRQPGAVTKAKESPPTFRDIME